MTDTTRKLATIVALDVAGYSARTEADEARLRKVIEGIAARHGGRVFNTAGDGLSWIATIYLALDEDADISTALIDQHRFDEGVQHLNEAIQLQPAVSFNLAEGKSLDGS